MRSVEAVLFDWGGTLTPWHQVDLRAQWYAYTQVYDPVRAGDLADALVEAEDVLWAGQRSSNGAAGTGHLQAVFDVVGIDTDSARHDVAMQAYLEFWDPHTYTDPEVPGLLKSLRAEGILVGVLSNTTWPREHHERVFARDGVQHLLDGAVYSSELPVGKPHVDAFRAALGAIGHGDPATTVYVGDRLWEDIHGAQQAGMRAVWVPHSVFPAAQLVEVHVQPDAVVRSIGDVLDVVRGWNQED